MSTYVLYLCMHVFMLCTCNSQIYSTYYLQTTSSNVIDVLRERACQYMRSFAPVSFCMNCDSTVPYSFALTYGTPVESKCADSIRISCNNFNNHAFKYHLCYNSVSVWLMGQSGHWRSLGRFCGSPS